jgi:hypothetical protein
VKYFCTFSEREQNISDVIGEILLYIKEREQNISDVTGEILLHVFQVSFNDTVHY